MAEEVDPVNDEKVSGMLANVFGVELPPDILSQACAFEFSEHNC